MSNTKKYEEISHLSTEDAFKITLDSTDSKEKHFYKVGQLTVYVSMLP